MNLATAIWETPESFRSQTCLATKQVRANGSTCQSPGQAAEVNDAGLRRASPEVVGVRRHRLEPDAPIDGNAYDREHPPQRRLPATLYEAADRLLASQPARALFGDAFVEHYAATRHWEEREFRKAITDWELARYFEII